MKKQACILLAGLLFLQGIQAQNCPCLPDAWEIKYSTLGGQSFEPVNGMKLTAGFTDTLFLMLRYKNACPVTYKVAILDSLGHQVDAWESTNNFPPPAPEHYRLFYQFRRVGYYTMEIKPVIGNIGCAPLRFHFTIRMPQGCACSNNGWKDFTATINDQVSTVQDGHTFYLLKGKTVKIEGSYQCKENCSNSYTATLTNLVGGHIIKTSYKVGELAFTYQFTNEGIYKLEITPACGYRKCTVAGFEFTIQKQ